MKLGESSLPDQVTQTNYDTCLTYLRVLVCHELKSHVQFIEVSRKSKASDPWLTAERIISLRRFFFKFFMLLIFVLHSSIPALIRMYVTDKMS